MRDLRKFVGLAALITAFVVTTAVSSEGQVRRRPAAKKVKPVAAKELVLRSEDGDTEMKSPGGRADKDARRASAKAVKAFAPGQVPTFTKPVVDQLQRSSRNFDGDVRQLPTDPQAYMERPEREDPNFKPLEIATGKSPVRSGRTLPTVPESLAPAPAPLVTFVGLGRTDVGNGYPPDTNGDVGPNHYIQTINTGIGIYDKSTGALLAGPFSFNTFMSQGAFGNICDTNNFGDPVVLYDSFDDRWILTDFAFTVNGSGDITSNSLQCFAVSKTGDPVSGGWYYYSISSPDALGDYPKFGVWPDGIYMTANMFGKGGISGGFIFSREWAFNKAQMYAGSSAPQIVTIDAPKLDNAAGGPGGTVFTIVPSNARLQSGTPPAGTPNYFVGTGAYLNALAVWKFQVNWANPAAATFTLANLSATSPNWASPAATVAAQGGNNLDTLATRTMMQVQYTNIGGAESLWATHTVSNTNTNGAGAAPKWYQLDVTGGTVAASAAQSALHAPDTTVFRWMPSLAVDRQGNMLLGYSASNSTMKPAIRWAGRLAGDPVNTLPQTETDMFAGTGAQTNTCGGVTCTRWGDYSSMSLDPADGCTFWFTTEYYAVDGGNYLTRIGSTKFPGCSAAAPGAISGTVTVPGGLALANAKVSLGGRTTTTAANGTYSFNNLPPGTYPTLSVSGIGRNSASTSAVVVPSGTTVTRDFTLSASTQAACLTDTAQADFASGSPANVDLTTSAGNVSLTRAALDQSNVSVGSSGVGTTITTWQGQTFTPSFTGQLTRADIVFFCSGCTGTIPNLTASIRATAANVPTGPDLATGTITGFASGTSAFYTANFAAPATLTAGTKYAIVVRPTANPSAGTYAFSRTGSSTLGQDLYAGGDRVSSVDSGTTWTINTTGGVVTDGGFRIYMTAPAGTLISAVKDANPTGGYSPTWTTLSWTASTPALTSVQFKVAASNNINGPFNFVGPDGTAGTFYTTSGGSLAQFNGKRYLKYTAFLNSTDPTQTPTLNDVTACFSNLAPTAAAVSVSGRVLNSGGSALRAASVTIVDSRGVSRTVMTNAFGYFSFDAVQSGETYMLRASARGYTFSPKTVTVSDTLTDIEFISGQ